MNIFIKVIPYDDDDDHDQFYDDTDGPNNDYY